MAGERGAARAAVGTGVRNAPVAKVRSDHSTKAIKGGHPAALARAHGREEQEKGGHRPDQRGRLPHVPLRVWIGRFMCVQYRTCRFALGDMARAAARRDATEVGRGRDGAERAFHQGAQHNARRARVPF